MKLSKQQFEAMVANAPRRTVPYHKLFLPPTYQARPAQGTALIGLDELAASIKALGLLENLIVVERARGRFAVCGGGRRWRAMGQLVSAGDWPENHPVPVLLVSAEQALLISLAENHHHVPMHPAEEFDAFAKLIEEGRSVEDVAACFGVTPLVVKRRMKLARVAPKLMALYREGEIELEYLMVLASVDDHARQEQAWDALPIWNRQVSQLRALLTQDELPSTDRLVRWVTLEAYEQAGGKVRPDLFSDAGTAYLSDRPLLEQLALQRLAHTATQLQAEGWRWVDTQLRYDYGTYGGFVRLHAQEREPTPDEAQRREECEAQIAALAEQLENMDEDEDEEACQSLRDSLDALESEQEAAGLARLHWPEAVKAQAGCVVFVDQDGTPAVKYGLVRPGARAAPTSAQSGGPVEDGEDQEGSAEAIVEAPSRAVHSKDLMRCLTAHRVTALQAELIQRPEVALAVLTAQLVQQVFACHDYRFSLSSQPLAIQLTDSQPELLKTLEGQEHCPALAAVDAASTRWQDGLPNDLTLSNLVPWLLGQPQAQVLQLLALLVARALTGIYSVESDHYCTDAVADAVALDMTQWWQPTAAGYFKHVAKQRIVAVVSEAVDTRAACPLEGLKKELCALQAEQLVAGLGWLPACLRRHTDTAESEPDFEPQAETESLESV
ncbi:ParB/RepB/Spo0J family partition protein [Pseudomonas sp. 18175]|uniref:ParB/RepB/Spo0J family partition protein n=1 Tax=Pseudomonas sp. 18175 TaxID=3390056 RepID=UPI003D213BA8